MTDAGPAGPPSVAGVWVVSAPDAPFARHVFTFHADGTMLQANPEAGNPHTSDSVGMGLWQAFGDRVVGRFVEVTATRATREDAGTGIVAFDVTLDRDGNRFVGRAEATFTAADGRPRAPAAPRSTPLEGVRFTLA